MCQDRHNNPLLLNTVHGGATNISLVFCPLSLGSFLESGFPGQGCVCFCASRDRLVAAWLELVLDNLSQVTERGPA